MSSSPLPIPTTTASDAPSESPDLLFELSPHPLNPLGEGRWIKTAGALIIGDEILNGKTLDRNSNYFARYCFENGIELKRVEVIPDEEDEIIEASRRMVQKYDFVITTGGIGPTHDDITYASNMGRRRMKLCVRGTSRRVAEWFASHLYVRLRTSESWRSI